MKEKKVTFRVLLFLVALLVTTLISAQVPTVTGTIIDESTNETLIGASIVVKGTTRGAITGLDGNYTIAVSPGGNPCFFIDRL